MTDQPGQDPTPGRPGGPDAGPTRARAASLSLRADRPAADQGPGMDAANQSLADALRVTYRLLQAALVLLVALYVLSGFQTVREGERGIRLLFGRDTARDLRPGFRFSFPYPVGELVKVPTDAPRLEVDDAFWPKLSPDEEKQPIEQVAARQSLKPGMDGSLITAEGAIAHARWSVSYARTDVTSYARRLVPQDEAELVRAAVERGVVHAVATATIDDLLKQSQGEVGSVAARAAEVAQETLDSVQSGLTITRLALKSVMPPLAVRERFSAVQSAASSVGQKLKNAQADRDRLMNQVAGQAAPYLLRAIAAYEEALTLGDEAGQARHLETITALMEGRAAEVGGEAVRPGLVTGEVASMLAAAEQYRTGVAQLRRAEYQEFEAKLAQHRANPGVMIHREWAEALAVFLDRPEVQTMWVPGAGPLVITLNLDPDILRDQQRAEAEARNRAAAQKRLQEHQANQFRTDTGAQTLRGD